ncbi:hypothetical protein CARN8_3460002 [mine drainage metagenome]|uniref:Uncharacterized protein n=1 Tax=mine drainage metagenome TaxID=410659 RepID=A0A3P3ZP96_9ZZZZ
MNRQFDPLFYNQIPDRIGWKVRQNLPDVMSGNTTNLQKAMLVVCHVELPPCLLKMKTYVDNGSAVSPCTRPRVRQLRKAGSLCCNVPR